MTKLRAFFAILICKLSRFACRVLHRGGTDMPGRIAQKICPQLLSILSRETAVVVVTGTNGKTTCSRMIEEAMTDAGLSPLANRSGANLSSGITTEFVMNSTLFGKCKKKYAVIEIDEAAARRTLGMLQPKVVVVTNLFRDQLDRYGEVTHTLENIREGIKKAPNALLCLNADCSLTSSLADDLPNKAVFFGINKSAAGNHAPSEVSDATHCIRCKTEYEYDYITFAHLGGYRCPKCGYSRRNPDYAVEKILSTGVDGTALKVAVKGEERIINVNLPAVYNIYNAIASVAAANEIGVDICDTVKALAEFHCGFGRMERFNLGKQGSRMMLVKNPAGCSQVLEYLSEIKDEYVLVACLNDRGADGHDISWIYDADFERLKDCPVKKLIVSGDRAYDLAVRFKYAGISSDIITVERSYEKIVSGLENCEYPVFLMPTYTAMLELRQTVVKHVGGTDFWEG